MTSVSTAPTSTSPSDFAAESRTLIACFPPARGPTSPLALSPEVISSYFAGKLVMPHIL